MRMSIQFAFAAIMAITFTAVPAFAQEDAADPVDAESDIEVRSGSTSCQQALEAESECSEGALARIRRACEGQISTVSEANAALFRQFNELWQQCTGESRTFGTTEEIDAALRTCRPTGQAMDCDEEEEEDEDPPNRPASRPQQICLDSAVPVCRGPNREIVRGEACEGRRIMRCDCPDPLREVDLNYRTVRQEHGQERNVIMTTCSNPNPAAERIRREELESLADRLRRLEMVCTDEEGNRTDTGDEPLLCETIWALIDRVTAISVSVQALDQALQDLESRVSRIEQQLADECNVTVAEWRAMSREERASCRGRGSDSGPSPHHFRLGVHGLALFRSEAGVISGYIGLRAEYEYDFDQSLGLIASAEGGFGNFGDVPELIRDVPVDDSAYFGVAVGLSYRINPEWQLGFQLAYRHFLNPGPYERNELDGDWVGSAITFDPSIRWNPHPNFFMGLGLGLGVGWTFADAQGQAVPLVGFAGEAWADIGFSF